MKKLVLCFALAISAIFGSSIDELGKLYERGDYVKASQIAEGACKKRDYFACAALGWQYESGKGVEKNISKARDLYELANNEGDFFGGLALDAFYARGVGGYTYKKAAQSYEKACELDDAKACASLGDLYEEGLAGKKDLKQAEKLYAKACKLDEATCSALGNFYEENGGGNSILLYEKACAKDARTCIFLANSSENNPKKYVRYMEKSCEAGLANACTIIGMAYSEAVESALKEDSEIDDDIVHKAIKFTKKACEMSDVMGCMNFTGMILNDTNNVLNLGKKPKIFWVFKTPAFSNKIKNGSLDWQKCRFLCNTTATTLGLMQLYVGQ